MGNKNLTNGVDNEERVTCAYSCKEYLKSECVYLNGVGYIKKDYEDQYKQCPDCGKYFDFNEDFCEIIIDEDLSCKYVCEHCVDEYYYCNNCDRYFTEEMWNYDECECKLCNCEDIDKGIVGYHGYNNWKYKSTSKDVESQHLYMGFELEVEMQDGKEYEATNVALKARRMMNKDIFSSHDRSLINGFEMVSNPMTMNYYRNIEDKIKNTLEYLKKYCKSHNTRTCGLHVHATRKWLGSNEEEQEKKINIIYLIMETFKEEIIKIARRNSIKYARYLITDEDKERLGEHYLSVSNIRKKRKEESSRERRMALNTTNRKTIEFRLFKGTLKFESFMAAIELVNTLCHLAKENTLEELEGLTWEDIITYGDNKYLRDYSISRGIESTTELKDYSKVYEEALMNDYKKKKEKSEKVIQILIDDYNAIIKPIMNTPVDVKTIMGDYNYILGFQDVMGRVFEEGKSLDYSVKEEIKNKPNFPDELGIEVMIREILSAFIILTKEESTIIGENEYKYNVTIDKVEKELRYRLDLIKKFLQ